MQDLTGCYVRREFHNINHPWYDTFSIRSKNGTRVENIKDFDSFTGAQSYIDKRSSPTCNNQILTVDDYYIADKSYREFGQLFTRYEICDKDGKSLDYLDAFTSIYEVQLYIDTVLRPRDKITDNQTSCGEKLNIPIEEKEHQVPYKFCEDQILSEIREYIDSTYNSHYADEDRKIQAVEFMMDQPDVAFGFLKGNMEKYSSRYGLKNGHNRVDLLKTIHYSILLLFYDHYRETQGE